MWLILSLTAAFLSLPAMSQEQGNHEALTPSDVANLTKPHFSPYAGRNFPTQVLWGDTHLHTSISVDAVTMNRVGQEDAFRAPSFLVAAMKDPLSGNLDRIQIVKGWMDKNGKTAEKVYDVVWSDERQPGADGKLPPVGNTVDVKTATWQNTIGATELMTVWTDPDFDASESAFYYARVIEIPTPRWTAYEALRINVEMTPNVPMVTQERAYTSPIWYTP